MTSSKQRWLYSLANLGNVIPTQAFGVVVLYFYVDVMRLPATWAATVMVIFAFYNALNNPVMGYISDRTRSRWGRRIPYMLFGTLPYVAAFALLFFAPFDGVEQPVPLLLYFIAGIFIWEGLATVVSTAYYSLLPDMFRAYEERTDVAVRMNVVQTVGLLIGAAAPVALAAAIGWPLMGVIFAVIAAAAMYIGLPGMVEPKQSKEEAYFSLVPAIKMTFANRSFITVVFAQTMRFFATGTLSMGMVFYMKYSIRADEALTSIALAAAFVSAGIALWPWRQLIANRFEARTTLMLAYLITGLSVLPLSFVSTIPGAIAASALVGVGLAGLILMGDVIMADVVDEDHVQTGQRRAGMYFGMSGLIITLSGALVSAVFGILMPAFGYDSSLAVQPETVNTGFRIFMSVPPLIGSLLAVAALALYPLHGARLKTVKASLAEVEGEAAGTADAAPAAA